MVAQQPLQAFQLMRPDVAVPALATHEIIRPLTPALFSTRDPPLVGIASQQAASPGGAYLEELGLQLIAGLAFALDLMAQHRDIHILTLLYIIIVLLSR